MLTLQKLVSQWMRAIIENILMLEVGWNIRWTYVCTHSERQKDSGERVQKWVRGVGADTFCVHIKWMDPNGRIGR